MRSTNLLLLLLVLLQAVRGALFRNIRHNLSGLPHERLPPSATRRTVDAPLRRCTPARAVAVVIRGLPPDWKQPLGRLAAYLASCSVGRPWPTEHWPCICLEEGSYS